MTISTANARTNHSSRFPRDRCTATSFCSCGTAATNASPLFFATNAHTSAPSPSTSAGQRSSQRHFGSTAKAIAVSAATGSTTTARWITSTCSGRSPKRSNIDASMAFIDLVRHLLHVQRPHSVHSAPQPIRNVGRGVAR